MQKISSFHLFILEMQSILESHYQTGHAQFMTMPTQTFFGQHAKNQAISLICSGDMFD